MKKFLFPVLGLLFFASSAFVVLSGGSDYTIGDGFTIAFKSKDPTGVFKNATGNIKFDENNLTDSKFDIKVVVNSIDTKNSMQNKKAQTSEWFESAKYPNIQFTSTKVEKVGADYQITGNLTMKGVTKSKKIPMKLVKSGTGITFTGKFTVNRIEYGVGEKSDAVPDIMNISYSLPAKSK
jgi:polyisoprenoid-binding protein YceI